MNHLYPHVSPCLSFVAPPGHVHAHPTRPRSQPGSALWARSALRAMPLQPIRRRRRQQVFWKRNRTQTVTYVPVVIRAIRMRNGVQSAFLSLSPSSVLTTSHHSTLQCAPPHERAPRRLTVPIEHAAPQQTMCEGGVERVMPCIGVEIP